MLKLESFVSSSYDLARIFSERQRSVSERQLAFGCGHAALGRHTGCPVVRCAAVVGLMSLLLSITGCEQVGEIVDDVKSSTSEAPEQNSDDPVAAIPAAQVQDSVSAAPAPAVRPEQVVESFTGLQPHEVTDVSIAGVLEHPDAAGMITKVASTSRELTAVGIANLTELPNLTELSLRPNRIPVDALKPIAQLTSLKSLNLTGPFVNDELVMMLGGMKSLETLNLKETAISPQVASVLAAMPNLTDLELSMTAADDVVVTALAEVPLRRLVLERTKITGEALKKIRGISSLESLSVAGTRLPGEAFKGFSKDGLKELDVSGTAFGIDGLTAIKGMRSLEKLVANNAGIVEHRKANVFRSFPKLTYLAAGGNSITDAGMEVFFKGHKTLQELRLGRNKRITDKGLSFLKRVETLKVLAVNDTLVTGAGVKALKEFLPDCRIITTEGIF